MNDLAWEDIDSWNCRTKVFGGWIIKTTEPVHHCETSVCGGGDGWDWRISTCFVPDPNHEWEL